MRILLILLMLLIPINVYALNEHGFIIEQWTYKYVDGTPSRGCSVVEEYPIACHVHTITESCRATPTGKPLGCKNIIISEIWTTGDYMDDIDADSDYMVIYRERQCDATIPNCAGLEPYWRVDIPPLEGVPYPQPEGRDDVVSVPERNAINNYLATFGITYDADSKTKGTIKDELLPILQAL